MVMQLLNPRDRNSSINWKRIKETLMSRVRGVLHKTHEQQQQLFAQQ